MAYHWLHQEDTKINIPSTEELNAITYYCIAVEVKDVHWTVSRRYSEFYDLHNVLSLEHGLSRDLLPPRKTLGNKSPAFIESRRVALESYLKYVLTYLSRSMPQVFTDFLHFHLYDIFYLLKKMAANFYRNSDLILKSNRPQIFNPLELYSIAECFKNPFPKLEQGNKYADLCHVLDLCSQLKYVTVKGIANFYMKSNIIPNDLIIDLIPFKAVETMSFEYFNMESVKDLGTLRLTVQSLSVHRCNIESVSQVLQCDDIHRKDIRNEHTWNMITKLDLSSNHLKSIDAAIKLVPNVELLILNDNNITTIDNLTSLINLRHFYACNNFISECDNLHTKLGNILTLNLSQNQIASVGGLAKLYSLETLILASNRIANISDVVCLGGLPCLENLTLTGNPVSTAIDYRIRVLEHFGDRAKDICLDNELALPTEIDKALILRALRIAKEGLTN